MGTVSDKLLALSSTKSAIKEAITEKGQSVGDVFSDYPAAILAIQTGPDTSDATATAGDILSGKTAYGASGKLTGTIPNKTEADLSVGGPTVTVPAGHYASRAQKSVATAQQAAPSISVSSGGLITASVTQGSGYVTGGTKLSTQQLATQGAATITPGASAKTAVAAGRYTTGAVVVAGDSDLVAGNIKKGVNIFGVNGTLEGGISYCTVTFFATGAGVTNLETTYVKHDGTSNFLNLKINTPTQIEKNCLLYAVGIGTLLIEGDVTHFNARINNSFSVVLYPYGDFKITAMGGGGN